MRRVKRTMVLRLISALLAVCCLLMVGGCSLAERFKKPPATDVVEKASIDTDRKVYYVSTDGLLVKGIPYNFISQNADGIIQECLNALCTDPEENDLAAAVPSEVSIVSYDYDSEKKQVNVYFDAAYADLPAARDILTRAAVVKTLTQFDSAVDYVQFMIDGSPLMENGRTVIMMKSDFVENTKADVKHLSVQLLHLYYASSDGTQLAAEDVQVHFLKTSPLTKVLVETLIAGPISSNLNPTMSSDVKLLNNVDVTDGICYVDFNQRFLDIINEQSFLLNVYSVVNSLTELDQVSAVQLMIDGEVISEAWGVPIGEPLTRRDDLISLPTDIIAVRETILETETGPETETAPETESETETETVPDLASEPVEESIGEEAPDRSH